MRNRPQYVTEALSNADLRLLQDKRVVCDEERKAVCKAAQLEKRLAKHILQGTVDKHRRLLGQHQRLDESDAEEDHVDSNTMEAMEERELNGDIVEGTSRV